MRMRVRVLPLLFVFLAAFFFAGCVNVVGGGAALSVVAFLVVALGMGLVACSDDSSNSNNATNNDGWTIGEDAASGDSNGPDDVRDTPDGDSLDVVDADAGHWESCCNDGVVDSCFCPAGATCNYGMYESCGDGTCAGGGASCPQIDAGGPDISEPDVGEPDVGEPDAGEPDVGEPGTWESCCNDGVVDSCFCPAGMACNYGMYQDCGEGTCVFGGDICPEDF